MAYYENLPIYWKAMRLAVFVEGRVRNFARYHKHTIDDDLWFMFADFRSGYENV